jgi:hypothetical protein
MDKVRKPSNSECYTPSSELSRICLKYSCFHSSWHFLLDASLCSLIHSAKILSLQFSFFYYSPDFVSVCKYRYRHISIKFYLCIVSCLLILYPWRWNFHIVYVLPHPSNSPKLSPLNITVATILCDLYAPGSFSLRNLLNWLFHFSYDKFNCFL